MFHNTQLKKGHNECKESWGKDLGRRGGGEGSNLNLVQFTNTKGVIKFTICRCQYLNSEQLLVFLDKEIDKFPI